MEAWLKTIDVKADAVLDVGGSANPVNTRVRSWDVKYYALADNHTERPKQLADMEFDMNKMLTPGDQPCKIMLREPCYEQLNSHAGFDITFCLELMEYIYDPMTALFNLNLLTKKGGTLYITFPFVYPQHNPIANDYLRYTPVGAKKLLEENGFRVLRTWSRYDTTGTLPTAYAAGRMKAAKGANHNITGTIIEAVVDSKATMEIKGIEKKEVSRQKPVATGGAMPQ